MVGADEERSIDFHVHNHPAERKAGPTATFISIFVIDMAAVIAPSTQSTAVLRLKRRGQLDFNACVLKRISCRHSWI
jgi:hypothetical protein